MKRLKRSLFYFFISIHLFACAQSKSVIKNACATYTIHIPGNIPVDRNGNEIPLRDTVLIIYIETTSPDITWNRAWLNGKTYSVIPTLIDSNYVEAGIKQINNEKLVIKSSGNDKLWRLQLIPAEKFEFAPAEIQRGELLISGTYKNRKILQRINSMTELTGIPTP